MKLFFSLSKEIGLIIGIVSLLFAVFAWLYPPTAKMTKKIKCMISALCLLLIGLLVLNYYAMSDYVRVPYVEHLEYSLAQNKLHELGLNAVPVSATQIVSSNDIVEHQHISGGTIVKIGEAIRLDLTSLTSIDKQTNPNIDNTTSDKTPSDASPNNNLSLGLKQETSPQNNSNGDALSIVIDNYEIFYDGFYYQEPQKDNSNSYGSINFSTGVSGTFHYSRPLTQQELNNWGHGGKLYDSNRNEIGTDGNYPSFWSDEKGHFAMEFPIGLSSGTYIYELYHIINDKLISAEITFTI